MQIFMLQSELSETVWWKLDEDLLVHINFLTMISKSLFYCCEKVSTQTNIWMIGKNSIKHHY